MYIINENTKSQSRGISYIEAGITENVELAEIVYKKNEETGTQFLAFYWEDASGARVSKTEWESKAPKVDPNGYIKTEQDAQNALVKKVDNQAVRIKHMLVDSGILENKDLDIKAESFEDYANQIIAAVGDKNKGKKVRIKVVYDKNNYTTLPSYATDLDGSYCWIESMDIQKEDSKMRILGMDKMERVSPDTIPGDSSPFDNEKTEGESTDTPQVSTEDDLPF